MAACSRLLFSDQITKKGEVKEGGHRISACSTTHEEKKREKKRGEEGRAFTTMKSGAIQEGRVGAVHLSKLTKRKELGEKKSRQVSH